MNVLIWLGMVLSGVSAVRFFPQVWKTFCVKRVDDLSFFGLMWIGTSSLLWLFYNIYTIQKAGLINLPYFINNFVQLLSVVALIFMYMVYEKKGKKSARTKKNKKNLQTLRRKVGRSS